MVITVKIDRRQFDKRMKRLADGIDDLTPALKDIAQSWYVSNRYFWSWGNKDKSGNNESLFAKLSPRYAARKKKIKGSEFPILYFSGALRDSLIEPSNENAIAKIVNKKTLILGTKVPYAKYHQEGGSVMPRRPMVFIAPKNEDERKASGRQKNRAAAITNILERYVQQLIKG